MNDLNFDELRSQSDEEFEQSMGILFKRHFWKLQTLLDGGDLGYVKFEYQRLMKNQADFEELLLERLKRIAKREKCWNSDPEDDQENFLDPK